MHINKTKKDLTTLNNNYTIKKITEQKKLYVRHGTKEIPFFVPCLSYVLLQPSS